MAGPLAIALVASSPASADDSTSSSPSGAELAGYSAQVEGLAVQLAFNIPGLLPLPDQNLIEADLPFARTSVNEGPVITAQGAPYYPGDILGNFGSLLSEFAPPGAPNLPNDPLQAEAQYPPAPGHGTDASFGGTPPAGSPIGPNVFSATAHAGTDGASVTSTLTDVALSAPSSTSSTPVELGSSGSGTGTVPQVDIGSVESANQVTIGASSVNGLASTVLKEIDIAGVLDISEVTSDASAQSDGSQGSPTADLQMSGVSVEGQPAYIDGQGVHVTGNTVTPGGVTPQEAQSALDSTFAQDGLNVRLLDPETKSNGAEGTADSGGIVVSVAHQFEVPFVPGEPTVPVPELGNVGLPAGVYNLTSSVTLGAATSDVQAAVSSASSPPGLGLPTGGTGGLGLGVASLGGSFGSSSGGLGSVAGLGGAQSASSTTGPQPLSLGARASTRLPLGIPAPLGWVFVALVACVIFTYPMLLAVRWQFLSGPGR